MPLPHKMLIDLTSPSCIDALHENEQMHIQDITFLAQLIIDNYFTNDLHESH